MTGAALWINGKSNPCWVRAKLASVVPGSVPRSLFSWNARLSGYVKSEQEEDALKLFRRMQEEGVEPDSFTFARVLNACASLGALEEGRSVHAQVIQSGCELNVFLGSTLVNMYAKCGSMDDACRVFHSMPTRDVVCWNILLAGFVKCELGRKALDLFGQMQAEGVRPNPVTLVMVLSACGSLTSLEEGRQLHAYVIKNHFESDVFVSSSLVDMYAKCGSFDDSWIVFNRMQTRTVVSWTAMIAGCVKCENGQQAVELFRKMQLEGVRPDSVTFVTVLTACASLAALEEGRRIHTLIIQSGCESHLFVANALVDMYTKCGSLEDAWRVFNGMATRDVVSWNSMLGGLSLHGHGHEAILLFEQMDSGGVEMNAVTFVCLLSACSHAGLVEEGVHFFKAMSSIYGILPTVDHYACLVDLLGRTGRLQEAEFILRKGPKTSNYGKVLMGLLSACQNHGNVEMGERVAKEVLELEPENAAGYVLLSNIYGAAGQWSNRDKVQEM